MTKLLFGITALFVGAAVLRLTQSNPCRSVPASVLTCENGAKSNGDTCTVCTRTGGDDPGLCWDLGQTEHWLTIPPSYLVDWWEQQDSVTSAEGAIDCDFSTWWQSPFTLFPPNNRHWMILDLQATHIIYEISIENHGWDLADVGSFILEASMVDPYVWQHVENSDSVRIDTVETQYFGGFRGTGRYWKITMWTTTGYNIWVHDVCFYGHSVSAKPCPQLNVDCNFDGNPQTVTSETSTGQPCHVSVDIHEGARSKDNPLQVPRTGALTLHGLASFSCGGTYQASALWTVPVNDTYTDVLIDLLHDIEDVQPDRLHLELPAKTMPLGFFQFQLQVIMRAAESSHVSVGVAQTYVGFGPMPIAPTLGNSARTVAGGDFWVNADESWDPDGLIPSSDFNYNWTCEVVYLPDPTPLSCIEVLDNILIYAGSRYKVFTPTKSESDASDECRKEGGYLASPNDEGEWAAILLVNNCVAGGQTRTIGVTDKDGDGQWSLSDGTDVTWSAWAPGYPSAPAADACAQVTSDGWTDDISCSSQNEYICELPVSDDCRVDGQTYFGDINYTLEGRDCQTWGTNSPHGENYSPQNSEPDVGNKCRDPGGDGYNWCYTVDAGKRWEECPIPRCAHKVGLVACGNILGKQMTDADPDGGRLHFEAKSDRQEGAIVKLSVVIEAEGRPPAFQRFVNIHVGGSDLSLKCRTNCNPENHVISEELSLYYDDATASDWSLVESPDEFPGLDFGLDVTWANYDKEMTVRPDVFWAAGNYTIRLTDNVDSTRISEWRFRVPLNPWRSSGDPSTEPCRLIPPVGIAVVDQFCVTCDDYADEYGPVQMEVKYEFIPAGVDTPTVAYPGDDPPTVIDFILSLYTGWVGYTSLVDIAPGTVIIILRAFAVDGRYTEVELPPIEVLASSILKSTFQSLRMMSGNSTILPVSAVNRAAGSLFSAVGNVFGASQTMALSEREAGITYSDVLEASKNATTVGFEALDVLDDIMLNAMMPEFTDPEDKEMFADFYTSQVHIRIQRQNLSVLEEKVYQVGGASDCLIRVASFPPLIGNKCPRGNTIGVQFYESNFNPFEYSNNSKEIETDIPGLSVKCADRTLSISNLGEPIDILTRRENKSLDDVVYIFNSAAPLGELSTFLFFAKKNMSSLGILVEFNSTLYPQPVTMYLSKHVPPTTDDYNWTTTLPVPDGQLFSIKWINNTFLTADPYMWHLPEDEISITDGDVVNMTKYYVGVQFGSELDVGSGDVVDFTLSVFETSCVYFAEEPIHLWQGDGCSAGAMSNMTHMHCRCDHLTKFSGFVAPNPLNIQEALSANVLENPAGLILVLAVFGSYLFLLLFSRKADRKDLTKAGVGILPGHRLNPRRDCQYLITVYTGFKGNAGTTAEISIVLHGFNESSPTITFRDPKRILFEQGSVDSFLVSTEQPLGGLTHMQVWHNNAGYSPAWFLNQVIVVNRGTNETTYFLANRWLAIDEDDGEIHRIIPTASLEDMTKFRNVFLAKSSRDMNDGHLWFSVAGRPARSPFTRVQRLSCCLTLLYSTMVTNIMFFGRGDDFDPPEPLRIAGLEIEPPISLPQLMIGIQSAAIILPVNLLIVFFFRNSGKRPKTNTNSKKADSQSSDDTLDSTRNMPKSKEALPSLVRNTPSNYCTTNSPSVGLRIRKNSDNAMSNIQQAAEVPHNNSTAKGNEEKAVPEKKSTLPWWVVYFGWLLVWAASFVAAFFTVLYTLSFGRAKAEAWVFTFVTSFFTDLFLVQPFKLMLIAMLFALLTRVS
ncbi:uncharacterized protein LOC118424955 [Branchiostoma floridae]|uniref:Uncharacterized protein LOC118424955 n=1 Tax=Branchiostoma floridae TaxID=7739 RepID=A0A9J7N4Y4_BRAFL|nr:uncharacterized protein LOC118424955 [Branchiostoma floridae]